MPLKKAVIPAAGFGTRVYPASRAVKKELFPVVGADGVCRAAIHYSVAELVAAGIEQVCVIVQPGDERDFRDYFSVPSPDLAAKLKPEHETVSDELARLGESVTFAYQEEQLGYGHAVYCARDFVEGEPFLLLLGDHVFRAPGPTCSEQMISVQARRGGSVTAVNRLGPDQLPYFGAIAGRPVEGDPRVIRVSEFKEKPSVEYARRNLRVHGLPEDVFLCHFGMHSFSPRIFDMLERLMREGRRERGEIQLTTAQHLLAQEEPYHAYEIEGERFDLGLPREYAETVWAMAKGEGSGARGLG